MRPGSRRVRRVRLTIFSAMALALVAGDAAAQLGPERKQAVEGIREVVLRPLEGQAHPYGLRVHLYNEELERGTRVMPYAARDETVEPLECNTRCLLFFVDRDPIAHFGHPVIIALWELGSDSPVAADRIQWMDAEWWPVVEEPPPPGMIPRRKQVFHAVALRAYGSERTRMDPEVADPDHRMGTIVYDAPASTPIADPAVFGSVTLEEPPPSTAPQPTPQPSPTPGCGVWAVVVVGWDDRNDTFETDAEGMYAVLKGHQVPADHIYYLSPRHPGDPTATPTVGDLKLPTSKSNVENAIKTLVPESIAQSGTTCDEFLLFYSSHGSGQLINGAITSVLKCVSDQSYGGNITPVELNGWLGNVPCKRVTVVLEACQSGGFLDELKISRNPANPQKRLVFTSTSPAGTSHRDVDGQGDPNPGDAGSETVWGYIEAFGMSASDRVLHKREVSFGEAVKYAMDNDITKINGENTPMAYPPEPWRVGAPQRAAHWCYRDSGLPDIDVPRLPASGTVSSATTTTISAAPPRVTISNTGVASVPVATVRLFEPKPMRWWQTPGIGQGSTPTAGTIDDALQRLFWPDDFRQVGNTQLLPGFDPGTTRSFCLKRYVSSFGARVAMPHLLVVVDSPRDPMTPGDLKIEALLANDNNVGTTMP